LVRNPEIVEVARNYGTTIRTCLPADPESKGGSEATVRMAKADLVPKDVNLREHYRSFGELLNGTDSRLLADDSVLSLFIPAIRSDFKVIETYFYRPGPALSCPIFAFFGDRDAI
jgi:hypothetical protein